MGAPPLTIGTRETPWYRLFFHTPLTTLAIFVTLSLIAKENYPFSNFPMYASPGAERAYFVIADGGGNPIPIGTLSGVTSSQVGKTYRNKSRKHGAEMKKSGKENRTERDRVVGAEIFQMLRQRAAKRGKELPEKLQLHLVEIRFADGHLEETKRILLAE
ncbi:MAG: hypothetical protein ABW214_01460 [Terrimicrobiaceae bacterium]